MATGKKVYVQSKPHADEPHYSSPEEDAQFAAAAERFNQGFPAPGDDEILHRHELRALKKINLARSQQKAEGTPCGSSFAVYTDPIDRQASATVTSEIAIASVAVLTRRGVADMRRIEQARRTKSGDAKFRPKPHPKWDEERERLESSPAPGGRSRSQREIATAIASKFNANVETVRSWMKKSKKVG